MKAAEVLRLYEAGRRDFRRVSLRGQNFTGKDLSGANFSGTDIRSTNFTNANLTGANFTQAKAGLQKRWAFSLVIVSLLLSIFSGFLSTFPGFFVSLTLAFDIFSLENQIPGWSALVVLVACLLVLLRKGIESVAVAVAVVLAVTGSLAVAIAISGYISSAVVGSLAVALIVALALAVAGSLVVALAVAGSLIVAVAGYVAVVLVGVGVGVGVVTGYGTLVVAGAFAGAGSVAGAFVGYVAVTLVSTYVGWRVLKDDHRDAWMRSVAIAFAAIGGTSFRGATLTDADFSETRLKGTDFRRAVLLRTRWRDAEKLDRVRPGETYLNNPKICEMLSTGNGQGQSYDHLLNLVGLNLQRVNLTKADLTASTLKTGTLQEATLINTYFIGADLNQVNLQGANLSNAQLVQTQLDQADLTGATLTGACIEDWNVNASTRMANVTCDYVYLKSNQRERRPSQGNFKPGEFAALFQQAVNTVDLIFKDGIDWQACFQSFQDLRTQYAEQDLSIQAIEKKRDGAFVVRVEVAEGADKSSIESDAKQLYESQLKTIEAQYEKQLRLQGAHLEDIQSILRVEREERTRLSKVVAKMAEGQTAPKYNLSNAQFAGGFAETVEGDQVGGTINNQAAEKPSLAEAAAEIQALLKQLEQTSPAETMTQKMTLATQAIAQIESNPTFKQRAVAALTAGGIKAFEAAIDHPVAAFVVGAIEEWKKS
ncbi:MAG: pentapeptide repeat-containing protein [Cyanobacteria bacterium P01_F01_bin.53]